MVAKILGENAKLVLLPNEPRNTATVRKLNCMLEERNDESMLHEGLANGTEKMPCRASQRRRSPFLGGI